jgi:hypothetical protein
LPLRLRFAHYFRLPGFEQRLTEIVRHAPFARLEDVRRMGLERCCENQC